MEWNVGLESPLAADMLATSALIMLSLALNSVRSAPLVERACPGVSRWTSGVYYSNPDGSLRSQVSVGFPCPAGNHFIKLTVIVSLLTC